MSASRNTRITPYERGVQHGALAGVGISIGVSLLAVITTGAATSLWKYYKKQQNLWQAEELIAKRRSIFPQDYDQSKTVPEEVLHKMLEAANWAPSHGKTEPWRFIVFQGEGLRSLGEKDAQIYKLLTPAAKYMPKKGEKKLQSKLQSSYVIAICLKRQASEKIPEMEEIEAVACAVQNMHLVATAHGVGAYWSSGATAYADEMKEFLKLGEKDKCLGFFYIGCPKIPHPQGTRKSIQDKVTWIRN